STLSNADQPPKRKEAAAPPIAIPVLIKLSIRSSSSLPAGHKIAPVGSGLAHGLVDKKYPRDFPRAVDGSKDIN
ncbi:hypothetical protein, partial [Brevibacillus parabrevis]|uniref:hypothetical protein n=1 Tax=Brevibacillus parabrevis TaxID=54914 RepID=UPI001E382A77